MRCKLGDLAVIVKAGEPGDLGRLVEVVQFAPQEHNNLGPNGLLYDGGPESWIIRALGGEFLLEDWSGNREWSQYASVDDDQLRPIRPDADPVETETEREVTA